MGKIQREPDGRISITYGGLEAPFMGIDATKPSGLYIKPNALADAGGLIAQDGYLNTIFLNPRVNIGLLSNKPTYVLGDIQVVTVNQTPPGVTKASWGFLFTCSATNLTLFEYRNGFLGAPTTINIAVTNQANNLSWYAINGVVYLTGLGLGAIYAYTPNPTGTSTFALLTNYLGGSYLGELNGRLLVLAVDQIVAGVYSYFPFRIAWSAGIGAYSQFNPLVGGLVTGAGFNNLPDVADEITGFFTIGPTGYIIRKQGITEISPLNSGIQPFDFNHLWASQKGIGTIFPNSLAQYGSAGIFLTDIGLFKFGLSGITQVEGDFWAQINSLLDKLLINTAGYPNDYTTLLASVVAGLVPLAINDEKKLTYFLYIPTSDGLLLIGNIETMQWNIISCWSNTQAIFTQIKSISKAAFLEIGADQSIPVVGALFGVLSNSLVLFSVDDTLLLPGLTPTPFLDSSPFVVFPREELGVTKDVTVDSITVVAEADVQGSDAVNILPGISSTDGSNKAYTPLQIGTLGSYVAYPTTVLFGTATNQFTARYPQLTLSVAMDAVASSALRIYKVVMFCTIDSKQAP